MLYRVKARNMLFIMQELEAVFAVLLLIMNDQHFPQVGKQEGLLNDMD